MSFRKSTIKCRNKSVFFEHIFFVEFIHLDIFQTEVYEKNLPRILCHEVEIILQRIIPFHFRLSKHLYCSKGYYFASSNFSRQPVGQQVFRAYQLMLPLILEILLSTTIEELYKKTA